ncbi:hypothetical protein KKI24_27345 [bacterium]|nr:hypothetical protein [bacterium]
MEKTKEIEGTVTEKIINRFDGLLKMFPDSPAFLGDDIDYPKPRRRFFKKKRPDIIELRNDIQKFSELKRVTHSRDIISKNLKTFPDWADLHALKAIQQFSDLAQSGNTEDKLDTLVDPFVRITKALYNEGLSIFNTNWFITIYLKYLEVIRERLLREYEFSKNHAQPEVRASAERLHLKLLKIPRLLQIKNSLGSMTTLNAKLKDSSILSESITLAEFRMACQAIAAKNPSKLISDGKPANSIIFVMLTLNSLFARIPVLRELVNRNINHMPDLNRDLILQKQAIINIGNISDFLMAVALGKRDSAKEIANKIYSQSVRNVEYYLENSILKQPHEVDPFFKVAWIVKESRNIFEAHINKNRLKKAKEYIAIMLGGRCQHRASLEMAINYRNELNALMLEYE